MHIPLFRSGIRPNFHTLRKDCESLLGLKNAVFYPDERYSNTIFTTPRSVFTHPRPILNRCVLQGLSYFPQGASFSKCSIDGDLHVGGKMDVENSLMRGLILASNITMLGTKHLAGFIQAERIDAKDSLLHNASAEGIIAKKSTFLGETGGSFLKATNTQFDICSFTAAKLDSVAARLLEGSHGKFSKIRAYEMRIGDISRLDHVTTIYLQTAARRLFLDNSCFETIELRLPSDRASSAVLTERKMGPQFSFRRVCLSNNTVVREITADDQRFLGEKELFIIADKSSSVERWKAFTETHFIRIDSERS